MPGAPSSVLVPTPLLLSGWQSSFSSLVCSLVIKSLKTIDPFLLKSLTLWFPYPRTKQTAADAAFAVAAPHHLESLRCYSFEARSGFKDHGA